MKKDYYMRIQALVCFSLLFLLPQASLSAQATAGGKVIGRVTDQSTGAAISNATVQVSGTTIGTMTDDSGRYEIRGVPAGTKILNVRRMGFAPKQVPNVVIKNDETTEQNVTIESAVTELLAQRITAAADRGTVAVALEQQRAAPAIVNAITTEQISKSPDGDAAQAVQRVSGVTVQDGKYVFVRGLGERYTTTSLNGARIPSPEPEKRVVPLDLFPSSLLQGITTSKTFTPNQPGDFGGAAVDIQTREFPLKQVLSYSSGITYNPGSTGKTFFSSPRAGSEWFGFGGSDRKLPGLADRAARTDIDQETTNQAIRSFRNIWSPKAQAILPNYSFSAAAGGQANPFGRRVGYIGSATYSNSQDVRQKEVRSGAVMDGSADTLQPYNRFAGRTTTFGVLWGGLLNLSTVVGDNTRVLLNNTYNRSTDNEATDMLGTLDDFSYPTQRRSLRFVERSVRSNQLRVERMFTDKHALTFSLTSSAVKRDEPDRTETDYVRETDPVTNTLLPYALNVGSLDGARKTFSFLSENNISSNVDYTRGILKVGYALRSTNRTADNFAYSINNSGGTLIDRRLLEQSPEQIFSGELTEPNANYFRIQLNTVGGTYTARDLVNAGYAMVTYPIGDRLTLIGGARLENAQMTVRSMSTTGGRSTSQLKNTDLLPALNVQYQLNDNQQLRLGLSQTVSRPEYREISPIEYYDVTTYETVVGDSALKRSLIQNYDARWEWYPRSGEIISFGVFAKRFDAPIERVDVATSGKSRLSFINADFGYNYGFEIEARKQLDILSESLTPFSIFTNLTLMKSSIDMSSDSTSAGTNKRRPMLGQAPYVVNAGLNYSSESGKLTSSLLYNVVGKRIRAGGVLPRPDMYELPRHVVDFSLQMPFFGPVEAKFDIKNLLNSSYEARQGTVTRFSYETGRAFSIGFRWKP